ncbi:unnamed protein product [Diabrotica balteata]|uniref:GPI ethanolamine phosphate transferase 1 n=1 Tax=Diabrotica balteata TaxID=107213 RepID=A0A9N9SLM3_DIABA|nr:unnamed protein product [Diabrotica balteata]
MPINEDLKRRLLAVEINYLRRSARTSRQERKTNESIRNTMNATEMVIDIIERRGSKWFGHLLRIPDEGWSQKPHKWKPHGRNKRDANSIMEEESEADEKNKKYTIIVSGLVIHFLLLLAVFDVYFASPLDNGMSPIRSTSNPPAKRLVLFVADGLRAEAIFGEEKEELIPFLTDKLKNVGSWGVAHTRVPTESRPGHVAMLAGIYEDPSAILKGWKSNPVNFDSVINQSTNAWAWGSPDIVKIFNKDKLSKIHISSYDAQIEDFGKQDTGILDTWVFQKVDVFLKNEVKSCTENCDQYFTNGNTFFLHLLGIDTAGHGYKPHSKEYKDNIRLVDRNIAIITELFNNLYQDGLTAFVFTADHGMTDWGSHGAGTDHETEVPVIAWGAGIEKNHKRQDINQIDLAPMLASLIGIHIPINSLGILPVNYINSSQENKAQMMKSNVLELLEIYNRKKLRTKSGALLYIPFKFDEFINEKLQQLQSLNTESQTDYLIFECQNLIKYLDKQLQKCQPQGGAILQQDSAPCYKSKEIMAFFKNKMINVLDWPGNSPDLNPIENVWAICKARLRKIDCTTKTKMIEAAI